jgi:murein DD-endopeptidase MepM/ murein hydrolase activator NlpD
MAWYPKALKKPISHNYTRTVTGKDCVILHTAASNGDSLQAWFNNPSAQASSHFYVRKSGVVEQYIDSKYMSWANVQGNPRSVTIETEGIGNEEWTAKQVQAIVALCQWACKTHSIPIRQMASSAASEKGIGWHRLGCDGNYPTTGILRGRNQRGGGQDWTGAAGYGRACPGDDRIKQMPAIIAAVKGTKSTKATKAATKETKETTVGTPHMVSPFQGRLTAGWRAYPNHAGMDIAPPTPGQTGLPIYAAFAGTVVKAVTWAKHGNRTSTWAPGRTGNGVLIENPDGEGQGYNHMRPIVKVGQKVVQGQVIGYNDTSGHQTGPHLHFECWADADNPYSDYDPQRCFTKYGVKVGSAPVSVVGSKTPAKRPSSKYLYAKLRVDGVKGPTTITAWQKLLKRYGYYKRTTDGTWGYYTALAMQAWLRKKGTYTKKYKLDGVWGKASIKALQTYLKKTKRLDAKKWRTDGLEGRETVKAEQRHLNAWRKK